MPTASGTNNKGIYLSIRVQISLIQLFFIMLNCNNKKRTIMPKIGAGNTMLVFFTNQLHANCIAQSIKKPVIYLKICLIIQKILARKIRNIV